MVSSTLSLPPPPAGCVPRNVLVLKQRVPMERPGFGSKGQKIAVLANHFDVSLSKTDGDFYHYTVALFYEDGRPVDNKGIGRRVIDKVESTYISHLNNKHIIYDGDKSLFTYGALPHNKFEFTVVLEEIKPTRRYDDDSSSLPNRRDGKRLKQSYGAKNIKVEISYVARIPMRSIANALRGQTSQHFQEAIRVLDCILRQNAAKKNCLLVRQSFFRHDPLNFKKLDGGLVGCPGFHSSFRATRGGLSLNMDVSTTIIIQPGPVIDFLLSNQKVQDPKYIDWTKARKTLRNLRVKILTTNREYKISGFSEKICREQMFLLKKPEGNIEVSVKDYFENHRQLPLRYSSNHPCINVGKPKHPMYFPIELCELVSLQRYTKALSITQRSSLVESCRQKPRERMQTLIKALKDSNYDSDPMLRTAGISIRPQFTQLEGRVLPTPKLKVGKGEDLFPRNGRWNLNHKTFVNPVSIERWAIVNFSARCDTRVLCDFMKTCSAKKGIVMNAPFYCFEENPQDRRESAHVRVDKMYATIKSKLPREPQLLLCILPERKNSDIYGPWKRKNLVDVGVVTQCIAPLKLNDQYVTNVLLKINAKLGGLNSVLSVEHSRSMRMVSERCTMIIGMDVSHGPPGRSDIPSVAAVVGSRTWPLVSRYRACVRTQSPKMEMIDSLFKPVSDTEDHGIMSELLLEFYQSSGGKKPEQIIVFRDGVSESQFNQVLNIELEQMIQACTFKNYNPKFTVIVAQKNHHTRFFQASNHDNVPAGTVIDNGVCHPTNNDFYLCAHAGMIGTSRPTHYQVLYDEIGFSADDVQELVHSLSYVYQKSTSAVSLVAPVSYAHLAAAQMIQFLKFDESNSETSSNTCVGGVDAVQQLPKLHRTVENSMFFC